MTELIVKNATQLLHEWIVWHYSKALLTNFFAGSVVLLVLILGIVLLCKMPK